MKHSLAPAQARSALAIARRLVFLFRAHPYAVMFWLGLFPALWMLGYWAMGGRVRDVPFFSPILVWIALGSPALALSLTILLAVVRGETATWPTFPGIIRSTWSVFLIQTLIQSPAVALAPLEVTPRTIFVFNGLAEISWWVLSLCTLTALPAAVDPRMKRTFWQALVWAWRQTKGSSLGTILLVSLPMFVVSWAAFAVRMSRPSYSELFWMESLRDFANSSIRLAAYLTYLDAEGWEFGKPKGQANK